jgi:hypothetical protein
MPSKKKKETKEERAIRKAVNQRTKEERLDELEGPLNKLLSLGLPENLEGVEKFYEIVDDFIETGRSFVGIIKVPEIKREFQCMLNNNKMHQLTIIFANTDRSEQHKKMKDEKQKKRDKKEQIQN